jgi:glyoxylase-like metal-dependent hydrolase (beta-lactamase superfamily II)
VREPVLKTSRIRALTEKLRWRVATLSHRRGERLAFAGAASFAFFLSAKSTDFDFASRTFLADCDRRLLRILSRERRYNLPSMLVRRTIKLSIIALALAVLIVAAPPACAQSSSSNVTSDWCKKLPRLPYKTLERVPSAVPWFEVYKVEPGVFAIYEPHQFEEVISFLILGDKRAVLLDTGLGIGDIKRVVTALTPLPITVLNSHTHNDHVGDNWEFDEIYGMDTGFTGTNAKGSTDDAQAELAPGSVCGELPADFDAKSYATRPFHITHVIHDGDTVDLGGRVLEIISTPGHTPDEICVLDRKNGLLFTGDNFYPGPIWLYRPETDLDAYVQSITRIAALAPKIHLVLPSHNVPVADPSQLPKLLTAIEKVRAEAVEPFAAGNGRVTYTVNGFVFLMATPK